MRNFLYYIACLLAGIIIGCIILYEIASAYDYMVLENKELNTLHWQVRVLIDKDSIEHRRYHLDSLIVKHHLTEYIDNSPNH